MQTMTDIQDQALVIELDDGAGQPVPGSSAGVTVDWSSSDATILTVTPSATDPTQWVVSAIKPGVAQVRVDVTLPSGKHVLGVMDVSVELSDIAVVVVKPSGAPTNRS